MKPTLVILAAGMASRYGSMKQVEAFGPSGETIMDYSIFDAIRAGFGKVIFIIRKEFHENFKNLAGNKLEGKIEVDYVFQELDAFTEGFQIPSGRTKPWGTAQAVLCASGSVKEPFAVINADDFYGRDGFEKAARFLMHECSDNNFAIIGYELMKTLSDYGTVNRGVCEVDADGRLISVVERLNVSMKNGSIFCNDGLEPVVLGNDRYASMNFWCFSPAIFGYSEKMFREFLEENIHKEKAEFFIPLVADRLISEKTAEIQVIKTSAQWFGVTYKQDAPMVRSRLNQLIEGGEYPTKLWD